VPPVRSRVGGGEEEVEERRSRLRKKAEETAEAVLNTASTLLDLALWAAENGVKASELEAPEDRDRVVEVLNEKSFRNVYRVYAATFTSLDRISGDVSIEVYKEAIIQFYRGITTEAPIVVRVKEDFPLYTYPPGDMQSILFFLLNPEVEEEAAKALQAVGAGSEAVARLHDVRTIASNLPKNLTDVYIEVHEPDTPFDVSSLIGFNNLKSFTVIEANMTEYDVVDYHVSLKVGAESAYYTLSRDNKSISLRLLLENFVPEEELVAVKRISDKVADAALRTYLIVKALRRLNEIEEREEEYEEDSNT